jgi:putative membrane-bound dehydrogenase-like protein
MSLFASTGVRSTDHSSIAIHGKAWSLDQNDWDQTKVVALRMAGSSGYRCRTMDFCCRCTLTQFFFEYHVRTGEPRFFVCHPIFVAADSLLKRLPTMIRLFHSYVVPATLLLAFSSLSAADEKKVTAEDMPRIPHTEADQAQAGFRLADGFTTQLVAAEPHVSDPVSACFDEFGRMYVAEMHGYPFSHEPTKLNPEGGGLKDAGIIRLLQDTNGDGRMDKSVVFAEGLNWPTSVCCYNGGVFVIAPDKLLYLKDTDGDDKADVYEEILTGFARDNVQAVTNGLLWGLDNHIYFAAGRNPKNLKHRGQPIPDPGSSDLRFNPRTEKFEVVSGGQQFGHSRDDWGVRFVCSNSDHIRQVIYPQAYLARNPYYVASGLTQSIAEDGASGRVFRTSPPEPWRIVRQKWRAAEKGYRLVINADGGWEFIPMDPSKKAGVVPTEYPVGFFTSATGITIYRGSAYPERYRGNAFVGDVGGNLVHRKLIDSSGVTYRARRADEGEELLASSDNWFRPVNFVNAPDGSLYILDMYRETIEHPFSIPEEIKAFLDLTSGRDRGRIYRLVSPDMQPVPVVRIGDLNGSELVAQLASPNGWNRDTAQRLLWERQDKSMVPAIEALLTSCKVSQGRMQALWTLDGLNALTTDHVRLGLSDAEPRVRAHAVRLSESFLRKSPELVASLMPLCADENPHVRFQLAFSLGESTSDEAVQAIVQMAADARNGAEIRTALMSSVGQTADRVVAGLLQDTERVGQPHVAAVIQDLGLIIGANPDPAQTASLLNTVATGNYPLNTRQLVLKSLGQGLARRGATIASVLKADSLSQELRDATAGLFNQALQVANDESASVGERAAAIQLFAFNSVDAVLDAVPEFLVSSSPQPLQQAAVQALGVQDSAQVAPTLLDGWRTYSPVVRRDVVDVLLSRNDHVQQLLKAVEAGTVKRGDIERDRKQLLMSHRDAKIKAHSLELFGGEVSTNRSKVVADYQNVLSLEGDATRGLAVFKKICSACHRVGDMGHQVAPDLVSVKNKSEADLLIAILDPNREAQPNYNTYTVVTQQGVSFNGIIASETANSITLRRAEAKEDVILRSNIDEMVASGISLMPEGLEKDLSPQQLADIIAFVKSITGDTNAN